jgi:hypothetical protein
MLVGLSSYVDDAIGEVFARLYEYEGRSFPWTASSVVSGATASTKEYIWICVPCINLQSIM